jgi:hypothetical protein
MLVCLLRGITILLSIAALCVLWISSLTVTLPVSLLIIIALAVLVAILGKLLAVPPILLAAWLEVHGVWTESPGVCAQVIVLLRLLSIFVLLPTVEVRHACGCGSNQQYETETFQQKRCISLVL